MKNVSTRNKLYMVVALVGILVVGLVGLGLFGMNTLSGLRGFVGAEELWSKSQKQAVHHLLLYESSRNKQDYDLFTKYLERQRGDKEARLELEKADPDFAVAREGLIKGGSHPLDVATMARLFVWFRNVEHIDRAMGIWGRADALIAALEIQGRELQQQIAAGGQTSERKIEAIHREIISLDEQLTVLEDAFSVALGEASRWAKGLLFWVLMAGGVLALILSMGLVSFVGNIIAKMQISREQLARQREELIQQSEELILKNSFVTAQAALAAQMREDLPVAELGDRILTFLAQYLKVPVGALYVNNGDEIFIFDAGYAFCPPAGAAEIPMGQGFIGQAAQERRPFVVDRLPAGYQQVSSGIGSSSPATLLVVPLVYLETVVGVMEFGSFAEFNEDQKNFVEHAASAIAITLHTSRARVALQAALDTSMRLAEELQAQQEELRAANEELESQSRRLRASEDVLRVVEEQGAKNIYTFFEKEPQC